MKSIINHEHECPAREIARLSRDMFYHTSLPVTTVLDEEKAACQPCERYTAQLAIQQIDCSTQVIGTRPIETPEM